jgi:RHS repeat-associated protein
MPVAMTAGGSTYYLAYDQVGSLRLVTDSGGKIVKRIDYDSFGNILTDSNENFTIPFGFAGGLHDRDTGLVRFGYRDYLPEIGKWTAKDPILFAGGDANLYGYVENDPVNWVDPYGLAKYLVSYQITSVGVGPATAYHISGIVLAQEQNSDSTHKGVKFSGYMFGIGAGLPFGYSEGSEMCEDGFDNPDVRRIGGSAGMLSGGSTSFGNNGQFSAGHLRLGHLVGTNMNPSTTRGFDAGLDLVGTTGLNKISIDGPIGDYSHQFYIRLGGE